MKHSPTFIVLVLALSLLPTHSHAQKIAAKTNLFYAAYSYTPNLGVEFGLGRKTTLELAGGYNPWNLEGSPDDNQKAVHWMAQAEARYWLCQRFNGHFFGLHALGSQYNISGHNLPLLFGSGSSAYRYQGWAAGAGISYGYQFLLGRRWNLELNIGVGYARMKYDKYRCAHCSEKIGSESKNYFGPTRAGISLIYIIKR